MYVDLVLGNVDLRLFVKTVEKDSSIDLSSIDSERIHSPCTWLNNDCQWQLLRIDRNLGWSGSQIEGETDPTSIVNVDDVLTACLL